jgi:hypothetical protein
VRFVTSVSSSLSPIPPVLARLRPVYNAFHTSDKAPPGCSENTRVEVLELLMAWADDSGGNKSVFWLTGMAGTGKSAITRTLCERLADAGLLGASFFISRTAAEQCDPANIVRTLVYHLAHTQPHLRPYICAALRDNPLVINDGLSSQLQILVAEPYARASQLDQPLIVVIDGLDECKKDKDTGCEGGQLLPLLLETFEACQPWLKLLVASRLEVTIKGMFTHIQPMTLRLHEVHRSFVDADITRYFIDCLGSIYNVRKSELPPGWPTQDVIDKLVRRSGAFFVYASTVVKLLQNPQLPPDETLRIVLSPRSHSHLYGRLDELYLQVLHKAMDVVTPELYAPQLPRLQKLLGVLLVLQIPVSVEWLAALLKIDQRTIRLDLQSLSAVILVPYDDSERGVRLFHSSFADFLQDPDRCLGRFHFDPQIILRDTTNITNTVLSLGPHCFELYLSILHAGRPSQCKLGKGLITSPTVQTSELYVGNEDTQNGVNINHEYGRRLLLISQFLEQLRQWDPQPGETLLVQQWIDWIDKVWTHYQVDLSLLSHILNSGNERHSTFP